ncbi:MAG: amidohydrolase [Vicinamibacterales bacterium]
MPDLVLTNATVLAGRGRPPANTVAIRDGVVAAVGDARAAAAAGPHARTFDLGGRTVIPAFHDPHAHIWKMGHLLTTMVDLRGVSGLGELVAKVTACRGRLPAGAWILGRGFNEAAMAEGRMPTRVELDRAAPGQPVVLTRTCGHIYAVNSAALAAAGITAATAAPVGGEIGRDDAGEPTGILRETAMGLVTRVLPPPTADDYERMIAAALRHQLSLGITMSACCGVSPELLAVYRAMDAGGRLPARITVMPFRRVDGVAAPVPLPEAHVSPMLRVDTVKFLADGGLSGATAALSVPYRHADTRGVLRFDRDELEALCRESHDAGWRIATHAIGDVTIEQVLDIYEALGPHPRGLRHRIEHFGLPSAAQLARAARLGVVAVPQAIFLLELGRNFREYLPDALLPRCYPLRAMLDAGVTVALSSDAPVVGDDNPLSGMAAAVLRRDRDGRTLLPDQALTAEEALDAYTRGAAEAVGLEDRLGTIAKGRWADLAVLTGNPLTTPADGLSELSVEMTLLGGQVVYERA